MLAYHLEHYKATIINHDFHVYIKTKYSYDYFKLTEVIIDTFLYKIGAVQFIALFLVNEPHLFLGRRW